MTTSHSDAVILFALSTAAVLGVLWAVWIEIGHRLQAARVREVMRLWRTDDPRDTY